MGMPRVRSRVGCPTQQSISGRMTLLVGGDGLCSYQCSEVPAVEGHCDGILATRIMASLGVGAVGISLFLSMAFYVRALRSPSPARTIPIVKMAMVTCAAAGGGPLGADARGFGVWPVGHCAASGSHFRAPYRRLGVGSAPVHH
jgi:hypothetical protein